MAVAYTHLTVARRSARKTLLKRFPYIAEKTKLKIRVSSSSFSSYSVLPLAYAPLGAEQCRDAITSTNSREILLALMPFANAYKLKISVNGDLSSAISRS